MIVDDPMAHLDRMPVGAEQPSENVRRGLRYGDMLALWSNERTLGPVIGITPVGSKLYLNPRAGDDLVTVWSSFHWYAITMPLVCWRVVEQPGLSKRGAAVKEAGAECYERAILKDVDILNQHGHPTAIPPKLNPTTMWRMDEHSFFWQEPARGTKYGDQIRFRSQLSQHEIEGTIVKVYLPHHCSGVWSVTAWSSDTKMLHQIGFANYTVVEQPRLAVRRRYVEQAMNEALQHDGEAPRGWANDMDYWPDPA